MSKSTAAKLRGGNVDSLAADELPPLPLDDLLQRVQRESPPPNRNLHPDQLPPFEDCQDAPLPERVSPSLIPEESPDDPLLPLPDKIDTPNSSVEGILEPPVSTDDVLNLGFSLYGPPSLPEIENFAAAQYSTEDLPPPPLMPPVELISQVQKELGKRNGQSQPGLKLLDREERGAYMRAVNLFHRLHRVGNEGRQGAINRLFQIVVSFPHGASVRAVGELFDKGCDLHEVEDAAALKEYWRSDSSLWMSRRLGTLELQSDSRYQTHLSWRAAHVLTTVMGRDRALDALQGVLLQEWFTMQRDAYSGSAYEFSYYHHFVLKRAQDMLEGSMDPFLQIYEGTIHDDPVMPTFIEVRNTAPNFTGQSTELVFLPSMQNTGQITSTFSRQTKNEKKNAQDAKGASDVE